MKRRGDETGWEPVICRFPRMFRGLFYRWEQRDGAYRHQKPEGTIKWAAAVKLAYFYQKHNNRSLAAFKCDSRGSRSCSKVGRGLRADPALRLVEWFNEAES